MAWGRLDDKANGNAKLLALSDSAWRMWGAGLIFCQDNLTDGFIPEHAIHAFGVRAKNKAAVADELCRSLVPGKGPLWHKVEGGFRVHDYLDWNDSKEVVLAEREKAKTRMQRLRRGRSGERSAEHQGEQMGELPLDRSGVHYHSTDAEERIGAAGDERESKPHPIRDILGHYAKGFDQKFSRKPHIDGPKDSAQIGRLLKQHDQKTVRDALDAFFADADDFVTKSGYSLGLFVSQFNRWLAKSAVNQQSKSVDPVRAKYAHFPAVASR